MNIKDFNPLHIAIVLAALVLGLAYYLAHNHRDQIKIVGYAKQQVQSDIAKLNLTISVNSGMHNKNTVIQQLYTKTDKLIKDLVVKGLKNEEISVSPVNSSLRTAYNSQTNMNMELGYRIERNVYVVTKNISGLNIIVNDLYSLLPANYGLNSYIQYLIEDPSEIKHELIQAASKDARRRADIIAKNTNRRVQKLINANIGVFQITQPHSTEVSSYGIYDTSSQEKTVSITVNGTFAL